MIRLYSLIALLSIATVNGQRELELYDEEICACSPSKFCFEVASPMPTFKNILDACGGALGFWSVGASPYDGMCFMKVLPDVHDDILVDEEGEDEWWLSTWQKLAVGDDADGPVRKLGPLPDLPEYDLGQVSHVEAVMYVELNYMGDVLTRDIRKGEWLAGEMITPDVITATHGLDHGISLYDQKDDLPYATVTKFVMATDAGHHLVQTMGWKNDWSCGAERHSSPIHEASLGGVAPVMFVSMNHT